MYTKNCKTFFEMLKEIKHPMFVNHKTYGDGDIFPTDNTDSIQEINRYKFKVNWFPKRVPRHFNGGRIAFSTNGVGATGYPHVKKIKWGPRFIPCTKIKLDGKPM